MPTFVGEPAREPCSRPHMSANTNPFRAFERQLDRMQRQFEEALKLWNVDQFGAPRTEMKTGEMGVDLVDHGDEFVLTVDVPGFERDGIGVRLSDHTIYVTAERETESTDEGDEFYIKSERARRSLRRSVRVPEPVDVDDVEATYNNGVLAVRMPKMEPGTPEGRSIDVQ